MEECVRCLDAGQPPILDLAKSTKEAAPRIRALYGASTTNDRRSDRDMNQMMPAVEEHLSI